MRRSVAAIVVLAAGEAGDEEAPELPPQLLVVGREVLQILLHQLKQRLAQVLREDPRREVSTRGGCMEHGIQSTVNSEATPTGKNCGGTPYPRVPCRLPACFRIGTTSSRLLAAATAFEM